MIQLSHIQDKSFYINIHGEDCVFIPMDLFLNNLFPLPKHTKKNRNILYWYVNRKYVSYNQIKKAIQNEQ
jgi:DNA mismatch repair ATPase MutL